jgi:hypothetical protein
MNRSERREPCPVAATSFQGIAEGAMPIAIASYLKFPASARAAIVSAEAEAERHFLEAISTVRLQSSPWTSARTLGHQDAGRFRTELTKYVMAAVLAFAKHACEAARTGHLQVDRIAGFVDSRIEAVIYHGYGLDREKAKALWDATDGSDDAYPCLCELREHIKGSAGWRDFLTDLQAVALKLSDPTKEMPSVSDNLKQW